MQDMGSEKYPEERLKGLREHRPPLQEGERTEKWRVRTRDLDDYEWWKALSAADRGELVTWARLQNWKPKHVLDEIEEEEEEP